MASEPPALAGGTPRAWRMRPTWTSTAAVVVWSALPKDRSRLSEVDYACRPISLIRFLSAWMSASAAVPAAPGKVIPSS